MSFTTVGCSLLMMFVASASAPISKDPPKRVGPTRAGMLLVQSELDLLPAAKRLVTLEVDQLQPAAFLELLRKQSGLKIEVQGTLPTLPVVSGSFRDVETKELLHWFAQQVRVSYKAEPPNKLSIITEAPSAQPPQGKKAS